MHIKNKWCIIILIWIIICMTKAMLIYSCDIYIYTHINIWVINVYVYLRGLRLSDRSSQNTEPHYGRKSFSNFSEAHQLQKSPKMMSLQQRGDWNVIFFYTFRLAFLLSNSRGKESWWPGCGQSRCFAISSCFLWRTFFFCPFCLWSLMMGGRRHTIVLVCPQPPCPAIYLLPVPDESRYHMTVYIELTGWALQLSDVQSLDQFSQVPCGTEGLRYTRYPGFFVTKNPHSPRVWSADVSSRVGRGGSRSTSQSSLCLDW